MQFNELNDNQRRLMVNSIQTFDAWRDAMARYARYRGGMTWKTVKGKQYLYRILDRFGHARSLGARSPETEAIYDEFVSAKTGLASRLKGLEGKLAEQARFNRAGRIGRLPNIIGAITTQLDRHNLLGDKLIIIGTNALYAYEAMAGVILDEEFVATTDVALLWDARARIRLAAMEGTADFSGLITLLRRADKSFEIVENTPFRAANRDGFMVDLIRQTPTPPWKEEPDRFFENDLIATDIWNMKWLLSAPKVEQTVICENGRPARMVVPYPRAFALFKLWLSSSSERQPIKKRRDLHQATALFALMEQYLPQFPLLPAALRMFPAAIAQSIPRTTR